MSKAFDAPEGHRLNPSEVLFFSFMVSAIALGDVFELVADSGWRISLAIFFSTLLFGAVWSIVLYAMNVFQGFSSKPQGVESASNLLLYSEVLAGVFLLVGTIVQVVFGKAEGTLWRRRW
jgi:hypothetical protein